MRVQELQHSGGRAAARELRPQLHGQGPTAHLQRQKPRFRIKVGVTTFLSFSQFTQPSNQSREPSPYYLFHFF